MANEHLKLYGFYVSRSFISDFRRKLGRKFKEVLKSFDLASISFDDVLSYPEPLNGNITCRHGKLVSNGNRVTRVVSDHTWNCLKALFPCSFEHKQNASDEKNMNCEHCQEGDMIGKEELKKWAKDTLGDVVCREVQKRQKPAEFSFDNNPGEIYLVNQGCLNDWRQMVESAYRSGTLPENDDDLPANSPFLCSHEKLRLPSKLTDALMGFCIDNWSFTDDFDPGYTYECLSRVELDSIQSSIIKLNKVQGLLDATDCIKNDGVWFFELRSHAKIIFVGDFQGKSSSSIISTYAFEPELCQLCSKENEAERKFTLTFSLLQPDEDIPLFNSSDADRTARNSRSTKKRREVILSANDSLAKLRLLLMEQAGFPIVGQRLILAKIYRELEFSSNEKPLVDLGIDNRDLIYVQYASSAGNKRGSNLGRKDKDALENEMIESLLDINAAFEKRNGVSTSAPIKYQAGHNSERGFSGTRLESAVVSNVEAVDTGKERHSESSTLRNGESCRSTVCSVEGALLTTGLDAASNEYKACKEKHISSTSSHAENGLMKKPSMINKETDVEIATAQDLQRTTETSSAANELEKRVLDNIYKNIIISRDNKETKNSTVIDLDGDD